MTDNEEANDSLAAIESEMTELVRGRFSKSGVSKRDFAKMANTTYVYTHDILSGKKTASVDKLILMCSALQIDVNVTAE